MQIHPDADHLTFREARANLSALCHAQKAKVILCDRNPTAIIVPLEPSGYDRYTTKDHRLAAAKRRFNAALQELRTHQEPHPCQ